MTEASPAIATRLTREQSKAKTRQRLLVAARTVFARRGYHGASVEEIAAAAGFSTGALYSNFDGKEDLFLALMEREIDHHARAIASAVAARPSVAGARRGGRAGGDGVYRAGAPARAAVHRVLGLRRPRAEGPAGD